MTVALRLALRDLYENSWRLVPLNALLGAIVVASVVVAVPVHAAAALVVLAGPVAAALVHCAVTVVRTGNLTLADGMAGLRLHWRRGLVFGTTVGCLLLLAFVAIRFYAGSAVGYALAFVVVYATLCAGALLLLGFVFAIAEPERPLRSAVRDGLEVVVRRPGATLGFALVLLLVNLAGIAAAVMPFLTLTIAYSFVAAARFVLPPTQEGAA